MTSQLDNSRIRVSLIGIAAIGFYLELKKSMEESGGTQESLKKRVTLMTKNETGVFAVNAGDAKKAVVCCRPVKPVPAGTPVPVGGDLA